MAPASSATSPAPRRTSSAAAELLVVEGLAKHYLGQARGAPTIRALDGVAFTLRRGEIVALVGESGSGKSTLMSLLAGLERPTAGSVRFDGKNLTDMSPAAFRTLRRRIQMVFQDPYESLNPRQTIAEAVGEPLLVHRLGGDARARRALVVAALHEVGLAPAESFLDRRPAQLSGGQRQRVAIAAALVTGPELVLADEPVSMLDVSVRAEILNLLARLRADHQIAVMLVTHDLATAVAIADRIAVMYLGRIVEIGPTHEVVASPAHPYTRALIAANPAPDPRRRHAVREARGKSSDAAAVPSGCRFAPRCPFAQPECAATDPELRPLGGSFAAGGERQAACLFAEAVSAETRRRA